MYFHLLTFIFILLKITEVVSWSWWVVMSPTLFIAGIALVLVVIAFLAVVISASVSVTKE